MSNTVDAGVVLTRRNFLNTAGIAVLSASAVSILAGCDAIPAAHAKAESRDVNPSPPDEALPAASLPPLQGEDRGGDGVHVSRFT